MNQARLLGLITGLNLLLLVLSVSQTRAGTGGTVAPVLRGRALEIVDDKGRVRATIAVMPADPKYKMPDGTTGYPETVPLRLITEEGRPNLKIGVSKDGSGAGFGGQDDPTYVQILAQGDNVSLKLTEQGRERVVEP